jgi:maltooligosyltrehalose trehalohydrolase
MANSAPPRFARRKVGSRPLGLDRWEFTVWAPGRKRVSVRLAAPEGREVDLRPDERGYWQGRVDAVGPGTRYFYVLDGSLERPDPASHFQPLGVHGPSELVDQASFAWEDAGWKGLTPRRMILYELHVGTFTLAGTFEAVLSRLDDLCDLGVNALSLMPVAQFPGERNWGYDGTFPFAVQSTYGGPDGLKTLVNACHRRGLAVVLDVVYNHLGPEGNYLADFGPYFTDRYRTFWGPAVNFDQAGSDEVRNYFFENALHWLETYHCDALRLDAVHAIHDESASPFLRELAEVVDRAAAGEGRPLNLIAESDLNDARIITPRSRGGFGIHAQLDDDFHHSLHVLLTGERSGYYVDFGGTLKLAKSLREGYVFTGEYSAFRGRRHGNSAAGRPARQFVVFSQNHDQVGNRLKGERLSVLAPPEALKAAAAAVLLSPHLPLLFMGEEYGETAPFLFFVHFGDPGLVEAVRKGRASEFAAFNWEERPPDPQAEATFLKSRLDWDKRGEGAGRRLLDFYRELIRLRTSIPALSRLEVRSLEVTVPRDGRTLVTRRWSGRSEVLVLLNFGAEPSRVSVRLPRGRWRLVLDSQDPAWSGPGSGLPRTLAGPTRLTLGPFAVALYERHGRRAGR